MADEQTTLRRQLVRIETDQQAANQTRQAAQRIQEDLERMRASVQEVGREFNITDDRLAKYGDGAREVGRRIDDLDDDLDQLRKTALEADKALDEMAERRAVQVDTSDVERAQREALERARLYGDVESRTRAITGAIGYVGGTGGAQFEKAANVGAELFAVNEAAGLLREELPQLIDGLGMTRSSVALLAGGATAAAAGIVLAYNAFRDADKKAREEAEKNVTLLKSQAEGYAQGLELTTKGIDDAVEAQQRRINILAEERDKFSQILDIEDQYNDLLDRQAQLEQDMATFATMGDWDAYAEAETALSGVTREIQALTDAAGVSELSDHIFDKARDELKTYNAEIENLDKGTQGLTEAYGSAIVSANDLASAQQNLVAARKEATAQIEQDSRTRIAWELEVERIKRDATKEQVEATISDLELQRQIIAQELDFLAERGDLTSTRQAELNALLDEYDGKIARLSDDVLTFVSRVGLFSESSGAGVLGSFLSNFAGTAMDAVAPQLDQAYQDRVELEAELARSVEYANDYLDAQAETEAKRALTLLREEEDFQRQRALDWSDHYRELAEQDRDYLDERADILKDMAADASEAEQERIDKLASYNKEARRLAQDHNDDLLRMQRDANRRAQDAIASLDAWSLRGVWQDLEDQTSDANKEYEKQQERREEDFEDQLELLDRERDARLDAGRQALDDLRIQHEREREETQRAFYEELRREDQARTIKLQRQEEDWRIEDQARLNHYLEQQGVTVQHYSTMTQITQAGMSTVQAVFQTAFQNMANAIPVGTSTPSAQGVAPQATNGVDAFGNILARIAYG